MFARTTLTAALIASLTLLGACSDDDADKDGDVTPSSGVNPTKEARNACDADVELKGAVEKKWQGEGFAITENQSGPVLYRAEKGKVQLTVLAAEGDFAAVASLRVGQKSYTAQGDGVEAADDGSGASVEADADAAGGGKPVTIAATITC